MCNLLSIKKQNILIYKDKGVEENSLVNTVKFFKERIDTSFYNITYVKSNELIEKDWGKNTKLLVIPGGADVQYDRALRGIGCHKIRRFVAEQGGKFLGICAGAYFGSRRVEFALGTELEVAENRELGFFEGKTVGPILKEYVYNSEKGSCAADILFKPLGIRFFSYYNGGCTFIDSDDSQKDYEVLATFHDKKDIPSIIKRNIGSGTVVLSGVHFEHNTEALKKSDSLETSTICKTILQTKDQMELAIEFILCKTLGLKTVD